MTIKENETIRNNIERKNHGRDMMSICRQIIDIRFAYNGDLGKLQQKTKDNIETIKMLSCFDIIDSKEAVELKDECISFFQEELKRAAEYPLRFC
jgi:hypothetical protein